jgi:hypothetical protein
MLLFKHTTAKSFLSAAQPSPEQGAGVVRTTEEGPGVGRAEAGVRTGAVVTGAGVTGKGTTQELL